MVIFYSFAVTVRLLDPVSSLLSFPKRCPYNHF